MTKTTLKYFLQILIQREKGNRSRLSDDEKYFKVLSIDIGTEREGKSFQTIHDEKYFKVVCIDFDSERQGKSFQTI